MVVSNKVVKYCWYISLSIGKVIASAVPILWMIIPGIYFEVGNTLLAAKVIATRSEELR
jgi:hypothetical protein